MKHSSLLWHGYFFIAQTGDKAQLLAVTTKLVRFTVKNIPTAALICVFKTLTDFVELS